MHGSWVMNKHRLVRVGVGLTCLEFDGEVLFQRPMDICREDQPDMAYVCLRLGNITVLYYGTSSGT